jgi:hypothetical protein
MRASALAWVICLLAAACSGRSSSVAAGSSAKQPQGAVQGATASLPDTAFVELRRDTIYGIRTPQGGCSFFFIDSGRPGEKRGVNHEMHTLSVDRMCRSVQAVGYRKALPARMLDTTGTASISASVDLDSAAIARLRRRK